MHRLNWQRLRNLEGKEALKIRLSNSVPVPTSWGARIMPGENIISCCRYGIWCTDHSKVAPLASEEQHLSIHVYFVEWHLVFKKVRRNYQQAYINSQFPYQTAWGIIASTTLRKRNVRPIGQKAKGIMTSTFYCIPGSISFLTCVAEQRRVSTSTVGKITIAENTSESHDQSVSGIPTRARNRDVTTIPNAISTQKQENTSLVDSWLERARRIEMRFDKLTNGDSMTFVDQICTTFILDRSKDSIHEHSIALSKLQKGIYQCHNEILQVAGVGSELSKVEKVQTRICTVVSWVEEVFCHAIVGWSDVQNLYTSKKFMYQN